MTQLTDNDIDNCKSRRVRNRSSGRWSVTQTFIGNVQWCKKQWCGILGLLLEISELCTIINPKLGYICITLYLYLSQFTGVKYVWPMGLVKAYS